ncbi:MAG: YrbL family protein [Pseudoxanthomonas sp.]
MALPTRPDTNDWQGLEIISRGANRLCARDPLDPTHCLKFELPPAERTRVGVRQNLRRWLARRFPWLGENETELRAYRRLRARLGTGTEGRLAACHGLVVLRQGKALRCDCVVLENGEPARSLYHHLFVDPLYPATALCEAVDSFEAWLLDNGIPLFDLNAGNFVVVPQTDRIQLVCIDAKSTLSGKEILPFSRWSRGLLRRKVARRARRLRERIAAALSGQANLQ